METHNRSIASGAMVVMGLTGVGYLLGFLAQLIIAKVFGISAELDAFVAAALVPEFIFGLGNAAFLTSFLILFPEYEKANGNEAGKKYVRRMVTIVIFFGLISTAVALIFSLWIAKIIAPGFSPAQLKITAMLIRVLSIAGFFFILSSLTTAILYYEHKLIPAKLLRVVISAIIIIVILIIGDKIGIKSLAVGTTLGIGVALLMQWWVVRKQGYVLSPSSWQNKEVKQLFLFSLPLVITSLLFYGNKVVMSMIASTTNQGSLAILNYGFLIINVPVLFFSESLVTSLFPHITKNAANNELQKIKDRVVKAVYALLFILVPVMIVFMIFNQEIIRVLFERGAFTEDATKAVSDVLFFFAVGLIPMGLIAVLGSTLSAVRRIKQRVYLFFSLLLFNASLALLFVQFFSYKGIALATSIGYWVVVIIGFWYLLRVLKWSEYHDFLVEGLKIIIVSLIIGIVFSEAHVSLLDQGFLSKNLYGSFLLFILIIILLLSYVTLMKGVKAKGLEIVIMELRK